MQQSEGHPLLLPSAVCRSVGHAVCCLNCRRPLLSPRFKPACSECSDHRSAAVWLLQSLSTPTQLGDDLHRHYSMTLKGIKNLRLIYCRLRCSLHDLSALLWHSAIIFFSLDLFLMHRYNCIILLMPLILCSIFNGLSLMGDCWGMLQPSPWDRFRLKMSKNCIWEVKE